MLVCACVFVVARLKTTQKRELAGGKTFPSWMVDWRHIFRLKEDEFCRRDHGRARVIGHLKRRCICSLE